MQRILFVPQATGLYSGKYVKVKIMLLRLVDIRIYICILYILYKIQRMADYVLIRQISAGYSADRICVLSPGGLGLKPDIHQPHEFFLLYIFATIKPSLFLNEQNFLSFSLNCGWFFFHSLSKAIRACLCLSCSYCMTIVISSCKVYKEISFFFTWLYVITSCYHYRVFIKYCFFPKFASSPSPALGCYWLYKKLPANRSDYSLALRWELWRSLTAM